MDKEIKDKRVEFRVSENEKKLWNAEAKARKISVGELIRNAVADFLGKIRDLVFVRKETIEHSRIVAISRLSNNLNQIARDLNSALSLMVVLESKSIALESIQGALSVVSESVLSQSSGTATKSVRYEINAVNPRLKL